VIVFDDFRGDPVDQEVQEFKGREGSLACREIGVNRGLLVALEAG